MKLPPHKILKTDIMRGCSIISSVLAVVRCFLCDADVVRMRFLETSAGDADKSAVLLECGYVGSAAVAHSGAETAHQLEYRVGEGTLEGDAALNSLGNQLFAALLEVAIL